MDSNPNSTMEYSVSTGIYTTTIAIFLLAVSTVVSLFIGKRKRLEQKMMFTEKELNYEKELRRVENEVREEMMERFAQELHDNVGHSLTCIKIHIENRKLDLPSLESVFGPIEQFLNEANDQLRSLSKSLNSDYVVQNGLADAINIEVNRLRLLRRQTIHFSPKSILLKLTNNQELMAYRIFQEIVHNTLRHSKAKNLWISLTEEDGFKLDIRDDGKGFEVTDKLNYLKGSGLRNIIKRAEMANMTCHITSHVGKGCSYQLSLAENV